MTQLMARARQLREVLIGWRCGEMPRAVINPPDKGQRRTFAAGDIFILLGDQDENDNEDVKTAQRGGGAKSPPKRR